MFATAFVAVLDPDAGSICWVNAGHEAPAVCGPAGIRTRLPPTGPALGMMADMKFEARETLFAPGETLFAFTDGVTESKDGAGRFYSEEKLLALLAERAPSASALLDRIEAAVAAHSSGAERSDDITMLAVQRTG
jgi:sigma-B regulation protein RsbU (phosphoserine phosphatase)